MKKLVVLFAFLFMVASSFTSCRETAREADDVEMMEDDMHMEEDEMEEMEEEIEDEY